MAFRISANHGDEKPYFRFDEATPGSAHVEVVIDDGSIDRLHASRLLRGMADRLLECEWPPGQSCSFSRPADCGGGADLRQPAVATMASAADG